MRILLAEDDQILGDGMRAGLRNRGFQVDWVRDGLVAEYELRAEAYSAAVLDLGLPTKDGMDVLTAIRKAGVTLPVLVLTARDEVSHRIRALDIGADDYVVKPADLGELSARLRALVRRAHGQPQETVIVQDVELNPASHTVMRQGHPVLLSAREFDLLHKLMLAAGRVLSRDQIEQYMYGSAQGVDRNTVIVYIHNIRRKIGDDFIQTVRGVGYTVPRVRAKPC